MSIATEANGVKPRHFGQGILPRPRKPKAAPVANVCRLTLEINDTAYRVWPITSDFHARALAVRKPDGTVYHVTRDDVEGGSIFACDCAHATYREPVEGCKHQKALRAVGLI